MDDLLKRSRLLHLAIDTRSGPHVTPHAFTWWAGRIWIVTFRDAFKERVIRERPGVSLLLGDGTHYVNVDADAKLLDPLDPLRLLDALPEAMLAPSATASWMVRNFRNVTGYLQDVIEGDMPAVIAPHRRLLVAMRPLDVTKVERPVANGEVSVRARVAIDTELGSIVVPGLWDPQEQRAFIAPLDVPSKMNVAIEIEGPFEDRPSLNRGAMLRGKAELESRGPRLTLRVTPQRETRWSGAQSATTDVA